MLFSAGSVGLADLREKKLNIAVAAGFHDDKAVESGSRRKEPFYRISVSGAIQPIRACHG